MSEPELTAEIQVLYGIGDRPPLHRAIILGAQHVLTMFGATIAVPLILGPAFGLAWRLRLGGHGGTAP